MIPSSEIRVGDAEREAVATELREHFVTGRLDYDELSGRLDQTFAARTRGDLSAVMSDLPSVPAEAPPLAGPVASASAGYRGSGHAGDGWQYGARQAAATFISSVGLLIALMTVGALGIFGLGSGQPLAIVLIFAAFALLRRLLFGIFGRGRGGRRGGRGRGGCGPRRRW